MAKLSYEELLHIAATKKLVVADVLKYENLKTEMVFTCKECKNRIVSNFESIRHYPIFTFFTCKDHLSF